MNKQIAIKELSVARTVPEWNLIRRSCLKFCSVRDMAEIDQSGLIVRTLGRDAK